MPKDDSPKTQSADAKGNFFMGQNFRYDVVGENSEGVMIGLNATFGERGFTDMILIRLALANVDYDVDYGKIKPRGHAKYKYKGKMLDGLKLPFFELKVSERPMPVFLLLQKMDEYEIWDAIETWMKLSFMDNGFIYTCDDLKSVLTLEPTEKMKPFVSIPLAFKAPPLIGSPKVKKADEPMPKLGYQSQEDVDPTPNNGNDDDADPAHENE